MSELHRDSAAATLRHPHASTSTCSTLGRANLGLFVLQLSTSVLVTANCADLLTVIVKTDGSFAAL